jgi:hypothetical protein
VPSFLARTEHFEWYASSGADSVRGFEWLQSRGVNYLEQVYDVYKKQILKIGDARRLPVRVEARSSSECSGGISGGTGGGSLSYCAGEWAANQFCYGILAHELCNLFTGENVSDGWPVAWWANHRSPFPTMIANEAMHAIVPNYYRMWGDYNDPLVLMFDGLYRGNQGMFPEMFQKMRELRVSLSGYSDPELSHVIYYFMFYAAGEQVGRYFVSPPMPPINPKLIARFEEKFGLGVMR